MEVLGLQGVGVQRHRWLLRDVDWSVHRGEQWVVLGSNGSGKTTLLSLLCGYLWPTVGSVEVLGHRFGRYDLRALRKEIGFVSSAFGEQVYQWRPEDTVREVVWSGIEASIGVFREPTAAERDRVGDLLARFGCAAVADQPLRRVSQGERQRVLLARAWMGRPRLMLLDEPCTGLDVAARERLLSALVDLGREPEAPTMVYVTHHVEEIMPVFSHGLLLDGGLVVAQGRLREVLHPARLSAAFGVPLDVTWNEGRPWPRVSGGAT